MKGEKSSGLPKNLQSNPGDVGKPYVVQEEWYQSD